MNLVKVLNIFIKRVNPFHQLICLVICIKNRMNFGFILFDTLLDYFNGIKSFKMNRFNLFNKVTSLFVSLNSFYFFFILIFRMFLQMFFLLFAHLQRFLRKFFPDKTKIMINFIEGHITCSNKLLH
jgi:hypothetical protein